VRAEEAIDELNRSIVGAWKDINEGCLQATEEEKPLVMRILNLSRVIQVLYSHSDAYTNSGGPTKDYIAALLCNPIMLPSP